MEAPIRLEKGQIERASQVLARAFRDDPELVGFIPDAEKRRKLLLPMFKVVLAHALKHGEVYTVSPAIEGVAVWLPSGAPEISLWTLLRGGGLGLLFKGGWGFLRKMQKDDNFARRLRRELAPFDHWYLAVLGVDPELQGQGYASRLLKPILARLDKEKMLAYLETSIEDYVPMYGHFGFEVIREETLPGSGAKMWVMLRDKKGEGETMDRLVPLAKSQLKPAAEMMARAFGDDPLSVYLFPDPVEREKKVPRIFRSMIAYGRLYGGAVISPNLEGAVVWIPSERTHHTLWRNIRSGETAMLFSIGGKAAARWKALGAYLGVMKKRHVPSTYCYGLLLAVDPVYQGKGYGGALLKAVLAGADREHRPCYLETMSERDVSFFEHFGFRVVEEGLVPGTELRVWGMMRDKKGRRE